MKNRRNYYRILQVQPDAPPEIIQSSYRTLMREMRRHPDLGGSGAEAVLINEAYAVLSDPLRRAEYDDELFRRFTKKRIPDTKQTLAPVLCPICRRSLLRKPCPEEACPHCRTPLPSDAPANDSTYHGRMLERTICSEDIFYYLRWPGERREGRMIDFSPKGMRFLCSDHLEINAVLKISSSLFQASGSVTNLREEYTEIGRLYAVGICFLAVRFTDTRGTFFSTSV